MFGQKQNSHRIRGHLLRRHERQLLRRDHPRQHVLPQGGVLLVLKENRENFEKWERQKTTDNRPNFCHSISFWIIFFLIPR